MPCLGAVAVDLRGFVVVLSLATLVVVLSSAHCCRFAAGAYGGGASAAAPATAPSLFGGAGVATAPTFGVTAPASSFTFGA